MESIKSDPQFQNLIRPQNCSILPTHNAPNAFNRRQIRANLEANLPVECHAQCCISINWLWPLVRVHEHCTKAVLLVNRCRLWLCKDSAVFAFQCLVHSL